MDQFAEICFKHRHDYYICHLTVVHVYNTDFFHIELMDADTIEILETADISYIGNNGYKKLPAFKNRSMRPLLLHLTNLVSNTCLAVKLQHLSNLQANNNGHHLKN